MIVRNRSVYVFFRRTIRGKLYALPDDYAKAIFKVMLCHYDRAQCREAVITRRDGNAMYYCYLQSLDHGEGVMGICMVLNGVHIIDMNRFIGDMRSLVYLCAKNEVIVYNQFPDLVLNGRGKDDKTLLFDSMTDFERLKRKAFVSRITCDKLPPEDYSLAKDSFIMFEEISPECLISIPKYSYAVIKLDNNYVRENERKLQLWWEEYDKCQTLKDLKNYVNTYGNINNPYLALASAIIRKCRSATIQDNKAGN